MTRICVIGGCGHHVPNLVKLAGNIKQIWRLRITYTHKFASCEISFVDILQMLNSKFGAFPEPTSDLDAIDMRQRQRT